MKKTTYLLVALLCMAFSLYGCDLKKKAAETSMNYVEIKNNTSSNKLIVLTFSTRDSLLDTTISFRRHTKKILLPIDKFSYCDVDINLCDRSEKFILDGSPITVNVMRFRHHGKYYVDENGEKQIVSLDDWFEDSHIEYFIKFDSLSLNTSDRRFEEQFNKLKKDAMNKENDLLTRHNRYNMMKRKLRSNDFYLVPEDVRDKLYARAVESASSVAWGMTNTEYFIVTQSIYGQYISSEAQKYREEYKKKIAEYEKQHPDDSAELASIKIDKIRKIYNLGSEMLRYDSNSIIAINALDYQISQAEELRSLKFDNVREASELLDQYLSEIGQALDSFGPDFKNIKAVKDYNLITRYSRL